MSTFEALVVIILGVYLLWNLYFSITGRNIANKRREEDLALANKQMKWDEQLKVLTKRMGEISTENQRLADTNRKWQAAYSSLFDQYQKLAKAYEEKTGERFDPDPDAPMADNYYEDFDKD